MKRTESYLKKVNDNDVSIAIDTETDGNNKIAKEEKISFEDFKNLYKGVIDMKCEQSLGSKDDKDLWEDCAKELYIKSRDYILKGDEYKAKKNLGENKSNNSLKEDPNYYIKQIDKIDGNIDDDYAIKIQNKTKDTSTNYLSVHKDIINMMKNYYKNYEDTQTSDKESKTENKTNNIDTENIENIIEVLKANGIKREKTLDLLSKDILNDLKTNYDEDTMMDGIYMQPAILDALRNRIAKITGNKPEMEVGYKAESKLTEDALDKDERYRTFAFMEDLIDVVDWDKVESDKNKPEEALSMIPKDAQSLKNFKDAIKYLLKNVNEKYLKESKLEEKRYYYGEVEKAKRELTHSIMDVEDIRDELRNNLDNKDYNYDAEEKDTINNAISELSKLANDLGGVKDNLEDAFKDHIRPLTDEEKDYIEKSKNKKESKLIESDDEKIQESFFNLYNSFDKLYGIQKMNPDELIKFLNDLKNHQRISDKDYNILKTYANKWQDLINETGYESNLNESKLQEDQYENERRRGRPNTRKLAKEIFEEDEESWRKDANAYKNVYEFTKQYQVELAAEWNLSYGAVQDVCMYLYELATDHPNDVKKETEAKKLDLSFSAEEAEKYRHEINTAIVSLFREEKVPSYELPTKTGTKLDKNTISYKLKVVNEDTKDIPGLVDKLKEAIETKLMDYVKIEAIRVTLDHKGDYTEITIILEGRKDSIIIKNNLK